MDKKTKILLFLIIILAIVLRLPEFFTIIPSEGIFESKIVWYDEAYSIFFAEQGFSQLISFSGFDSTPFLFYLLLRIWGLIFGWQIMTLAILPFLFSLGTVIVIYFIGKEIFNQKIGLLASFFLAISALSINYSTEIRAYSLAVFWASLSFLFWWRIIKKQLNLNWFYYILFSCLLIYTHYTGLALVLTQGILFLIYKVPKRSLYWLIWLFYLPQFFLFQRWRDVLGGNTDLMSYFERAFSHGQLSTLPTYFYALLFGEYNYYNPINLLIGFGIFILVTYGLYKYRSEKKVQVIYLFLIFGLFFLAVLKFIYQLKYFLIFTIPFVVFLSYLLNKISNQLVRKFTISAVTILMIFSTVLHYQALPHNMFQYYAPEIFKHIQENEEPNDIILVDHFNEILANFYYHGDLEKKLFFPYQNELTTDWQIRWRYWDHNIINQNNVSLVQGLIKDYERVWLVGYLPRNTSLQDPSNCLEDYFARNYQLKYSYQFPEITNGQSVDLMLYEKID